MSLCTVNRTLALPPQIYSGSSGERLFSLVRICFEGGKAHETNEICDLHAYTSVAPLL